MKDFLVGALVLIGNVAAFVFLSYLFLDWPWRLF